MDKELEKQIREIVRQELSRDAIELMHEQEKISTGVKAELERLGLAK